MQPVNEHWNPYCYCDDLPETPRIPSRGDRDHQQADGNQQGNRRDKQPACYHGNEPVQNTLDMMLLYTSLIISRQFGDGPLEDISSDEFFDAENLELRRSKADEYHEWDYHNGLAQKHFVVR
jgi:hypothetical protein